VKTWKGISIGVYKMLERELRIWRVLAFAVVLIFLSGAAAEDRTKSKENQVGQRR
jgi:hypothetical protein